MTHKNRVLALEKKMSTGVPKVLIAFSKEEVSEKVAQFRKDYPYDPLPVICRPDPIIKKR